MKPPLRNFGITLAICWVLLGLAAWPLANARHVPAGIAFPIALAFLTEVSFYLLPGFEGLRAWIGSHYSPAQIAAALAVTSLLPYLIFALGTGGFGLPQLLVLAILMTAVSIWYVPKIVNRGWSIVRNLGFLALLAAVILSGVLKWIYPSPVAKLPMDVLGHLTLVRCAILSVLLNRRSESIVFGFLPTLRETRIGSLWALGCAAVAYPIGRVLGQMPPSNHPWRPMQSVLVMLGIFWFVALSEEFFFRALLQQWLTEWSGAKIIGLLTTSAIFGLCHLGYRNQFPNWRFAILAATLGLFCGMAYQQSRSMRASMITHTLVVGAFRLFLA